MSLSPNQPLTADHLASFKLDRVLSYSLSAPNIYLLGTISSQPAILHLQKPVFDVDHITELFSPPTVNRRDDADPQRTDGRDGSVGDGLRVESIGSNDIYKWAHAWLGASRPPDLRVDVICPCTEVHIRKYSTQKQRMVTETPEHYRTIVKPFIDAFPASRTQWVRNILSGQEEAERVVFDDPDPVEGFMIIPDLKWDMKTVSTLYLSAIVHDATIKSLRDLTRRHLPLLRRIISTANRVCEQRYGVPNGGLRIYVHYQPSYYHFHVHIVSVEYESFSGVACGRSRLLQDVIDLLEISDPTEEQSLIQRMSITYPLGEEHGLFEAMSAVQNP